MSAAAKALKGSDGSDEDVLTYAMFPQVAPKFFESRSQGPKNLGKSPEKAEAAQAPQAQPAAQGADQLKTKVSYVITLNGKEHQVTVAQQK